MVKTNILFQCEKVLSAASPSACLSQKQIYVFITLSIREKNPLNPVGSHTKRILFENFMMINLIVFIMWPTSWEKVS